MQEQREAAAERRRGAFCAKVMPSKNGLHSGEVGAGGFGGGRSPVDEPVFAARHDEKKAFSHVSRWVKLGIMLNIGQKIRGSK